MHRFVWTRWAGVILALVGLFTVALVPLGTVPARAAPLDSHAFTAPASTGSMEIAKVTLGDTAAGGPALWAAGPSTGVPSTGLGAALAWRGTDSAGHLNTMTSSDGISFGAKKTLPETSPLAPAVVASANGGLIVAWVGDDSRHSLNIRCDGCAATPSKVTLGDTSFASPALAAVGSGFALAWAGTDANHSLNILSFTAGSGGIALGGKAVLSQFSSRSAPRLTYNAVTGTRILTWSATSPANAVSIATSVSGGAWSMAAGSPLSDTSAYAPTALPVGASALPQAFLTWTGTDPARSLNVQSTDAFPAWSAISKSVYPDTAADAPALAFLHRDGRLTMAWTGTDSAHRLNIAAITTKEFASCATPAGVTAVSSTVISSVPTSNKWVALTFDAGGADGDRATRILDTLRARGLHVTWFMTGEWAQAHPAVLQRIRDDGHEIGNHTMDHADLKTPARTNAFVCAELNQADAIVAGINGKTTRPYFRPPFGSYNDQTRVRAAALGYRTVMWSIDPIDWADTTTAQQIYDRVVNSPNLKPGAIVLMHAGSLHEPEALGNVITGLQNKGYTIVTLTTLLS